MNQISQPKILIVDDDKLLCELLSEQLNDEKFITAYVLNGFDAIEKIKQEDYNLVIANLNMPGMNGYELLSKIKQYDSSIPVIMLSAQYDPQIVTKCIKLGADDYLAKPFDSEILLDSVIKYFK